MLHAIASVEITTCNVALGGYVALDGLSQLKPNNELVSFFLIICRLLNYHLWQCNFHSPYYVNNNVEMVPLVSISVEVSIKMSGILFLGKHLCVQN